jgi:hypothetical protein
MRTSWTPTAVAVRGTVCALSLVLLVAAAKPALAADYWPDDAPRTYVFGSGAEESRLAIDPFDAGRATFVVVGQGCSIDWVADVEPSGRLGVDTASFFCPGEVDPPLDLVFEADEVLFDPAWAGGNTQLLQGTADGVPFNLYVRVGMPRTVTIPEGSFEAVQMELSADPFFATTLLTVDLSATAGPIRVDGQDRTAVIDGIVSTDEQSWSALKAGFDR